MPEWTLILLAVIGIIFVGLFFTALSLVKNFARLLFLGVVGFLLLVLVGRACTPVVTRTDPTFPPGQTAPSPRADREFNLPESLRDLGRRIDNFVFRGGERESLPPEGTTTVPAPFPRTSLGQQEDLIYTLPSNFPDPLTGQVPPAPPQTATQPTTTRSATGAATDSPPQQRPVSAMW
jgi:hypothetical protein